MMIGPAADRKTSPGQVPWRRSTEIGFAGPAVTDDGVAGARAFQVQRRVWRRRPACPGAERRRGSARGRGRWGQGGEDAVGRPLAVAATTPATKKKGWPAGEDGTSID